MWSSAYYIAARGGNEGTPRIPRESRESLNKSCGTPVGMQKKCRNEDAFFCNAATAVPLVAKKNPPVLLSNPIPTKKCCFWIWLSPRYKISEFFTIVPVLTSTLTVCRRFRGGLYIGLRVRYKYYIKT